MTIDVTYATIRREIAQGGVMVHVSSLGHNPSKIGNGLIAHHLSEKPSFSERIERTWSVVTVVVLDTPRMDVSNS